MSPRRRARTHPLTPRLGWPPDATDGKMSPVRSWALVRPVMEVAVEEARPRNRLAAVDERDIRPSGRASHLLEESPNTGVVEHGLDIVGLFDLAEVHPPRPCQNTQHQDHTGVDVEPAQVAEFQPRSATDRVVRISPPQHAGSPQRRQTTSPENTMCAKMIHASSSVGRRVAILPVEDGDGPESSYGTLPIRESPHDSTGSAVAASVGRSSPPATPGARSTSGERRRRGTAN